jgi:acyl dehydratase
MSNKAALPRELMIVSTAAVPESVARYAALTADYNPIHIDPEFAARTVYGRPIAHGTMGLNLVIEAIERTFGEVPEHTAIDARFVRAVLVSSTIRAGGVLRDATAGTYDVFVETEAGERVVEGVCTLGGGAAGPNQERKS